MSEAPTGAPFEQPASFAFTPENRAKADAYIAKYPAGRQASAVLSLLYLAQDQHDNWIPRAAMDHVAEILSMPPIRVYEVASFYTMFNLRPVGQYFLQVCTTTPCWLRGSDAVMEACKKKLGVGVGDTTADKKFTLLEVECLGACVNAPMLQIDKDFYEDLNGPVTEKLLEELRAGRAVKPGSQNGRHTSEPLGGATTLGDPALYDGSMIGHQKRSAAATDADGKTPAPKPPGAAS